jgi:glycerol kinase
MEKYILALDQGTTSSRAMLFDRKGVIQYTSQSEFTQIFPKPGWVEHNPDEIWNTQMNVAADAISGLGIKANAVAGIGITNQRETTIIWDRKTSIPVYNAIVWQDRRTSDFCDELIALGLQERIREKTGLVVDAYFSATKIKWILDHVEGVRNRADRGELAFGTVDSWLVWKMTGGRCHVTDVSNASRTMLYNINTLAWDEELLGIFGIPKSILPEVRDSSEVYGITDTVLLPDGIAISGIAGDQQAAMFGQMCIDEGMVKNTYGTGCFILLNTGSKPFISKNNLVTTIGWKIGIELSYALEGSIFIAGAAVQWLRDGLGIIGSSSEVESLALSVPNNGDVYFVPAFTGLGAPYWDSNARGLLTGISRGTTKAHIARAALEAMAFQTMDVLRVMEQDTGIKIKELRVDGGASVNNLLMQFQADLAGIPVIKPSITETTALGAAYLAGLSTGFWDSIEDIKHLWQQEKVFNAGMDKMKAEKLLSGWRQAVERTVFRKL